MSPSFSLGNEAAFKAKWNDSMRLLSLMFSSKELLFQEEGSLGSGVIGPHYGNRHVLPELPETFSLPRSATLTPNPSPRFPEDPFPNGLGRFAPWEWHTQNSERIQGVLKGDTEWQGVPLKKIEGQSFQMTAHSFAVAKQFGCRFAVVSEGDSVTGMQWCFALDQETEIQCPSRDSPNRFFSSNFQEDVDVWLHPFPSERKAELTLKKGPLKFRLSSETVSSEHSIRIVYQKEQPFFTVAFLSAKNPLHPNLSVSQLWMNIEPLP